MSIKNICSFSMFPFFPAVLIFWLGLSAVTFASDLSGLWSVGIEGGVNKLTEGYWDYSNVDMFGGMTIGRSITTHWNGQLSLRKGQVQPGVREPGTEARLGFESFGDLRTSMWQPSAVMQYRFAPHSRFCPTMGVGLGVTSWEVQATDGPEEPVQGFDIHGDQQELSGSNITISLDFGLDYFITESLALNVGGRYHLLHGNELDNIGLSSQWGAVHVDANTAMAQAYVGLTMWFGNTDWDGDGIKNQADKCPTSAEDFDGFEDEDGCPEIDNDGDRVIDKRDECPNEPEDIDGFQDLDGCPDPDNDEDGVLDGDDLCPNTPAGTRVNKDGCIEVEAATSAPVEIKKPPVKAPVAAPVVAAKTPVDDSKVLKGVTFKSGSAQLAPGSITVLVEVAARLQATPQEKFEIRGHTDSAGDAEDNRDLSMRRAISVRDSLIQMGVADSQLKAVGYGEDEPLVSNSTSQGRSRNRRVELHKVK
jgi:outer membrane protein OmpA-like peptidoglycan-associated protein/opacity protein-like surface antigen